MAKVIVPILKLSYPAEFSFINDVQDVFERVGVWQEEETFTYTGRVCVYGKDSEADATKAQIETDLRAMEASSLLASGQADTLLAFLRLHEWDVSFFVDCH